MARALDKQTFTWLDPHVLTAQSTSAPSLPKERVATQALEERMAALHLFPHLCRSLRRHQVQPLVRRPVQTLQVALAAAPLALRLPTAALSGDTAVQALTTAMTSLSGGQAAAGQRQCPRQHPPLQLRPQ